MSLQSVHFSTITIPNQPSDFQETGGNFKRVATDPYEFRRQKFSFRLHCTSEWSTPQKLKRS